MIWYCLCHGWEQRIFLGDILLFGGVNIFGILVGIFLEYWWEYFWTIFNFWLLVSPHMKVFGFVRRGRMLLITITALQTHSICKWEEILCNFFQKYFKNSQGDTIWSRAYWQIRHSLWAERDNFHPSSFSKHSPNRLVLSLFVCFILPQKTPFI